MASSRNWCTPLQQQPSGGVMNYRWLLQRGGLESEWLRSQCDKLSRRYPDRPLCRRCPAALAVAMGAGRFLQPRMSVPGQSHESSPAAVAQVCSLHWAPGYSIRHPDVRTGVAGRLAGRPIWIGWYAVAANHAFRRGEAAHDVADDLFLPDHAAVFLSRLGQGLRHPFVPLLFQLTEPGLRPIRKIIPPIAGIDLSPLFALIGLRFLILLLGW
ncbi:MAG: YggT family protein [Xanthomonadales bacterium]|nr:YggT family protein [Xanthomonadales bacterium]